MYNLDYLPNCILKEVFLEKINNYVGSYDFSLLISKLRQLFDIVTKESSNINILFPEYTPHDARHTDNMFQIADMFLEKRIYNNLNPFELYLLITAIFSHDWGMAVSRDELQMISAGTRKESENIILLDDEFEQFENFLNKNNITETIKNEGDLTIDVWRDYLRGTHAERSKKRILHFFKDDDTGLGNALALIVWRHALSLTDILNNTKFGTSIPTGINKSVNILALTFYSNQINHHDFNIFQLKEFYPLDKVLLPQDIENGEEYLETRIFDISKDLNAENMEGFIIFVLPKKEYKFKLIERGATFAYGTLMVTNNEGKNLALIRYDEYSEFSFFYNDGILVEKERLVINRTSFDYMRKGLPCYLRLNIPNINKDNISISRTKFKKSEPLSESLKTSLLKYVSKDLSSKILNLSPNEQLEEVASTSALYGISGYKLFHTLDHCCKFP